MLKAGDQAPRFSLPAADGSTFDLAKSKGRHVVVYFYPRDDTPGCTVEAIDFSRARKDFEAAGASVVGISKDSIASHCRFRDKHDLTITLASDQDLTVHKAFGAWGEKTMYGKKIEGVLRSTFLVGPNGKIVRAWPSVKVAGHVAQVLDTLRGGDGAADAPAPKKPAAAKATKAAPKAAKPAAKASPKAASKVAKTAKTQARKKA
ncbi:MAG: peroxiredoxin [Polyangiaceae bacterium]|nr:peroxiredoxin [Polyangiaceae bacterium]